eukprot:TRINITY_DN14794_c0_g1_i1.p1 TRINITY_DN14794_c0_g1~~TRINITY_DN14794_c0_g1_i1.p1  ORF type:complete len:269 (+),score=49.47 TRINITY_DN14794_c0_g1_i1:68-808(+)
MSPSPVFDLRFEASSAIGSLLLYFGVYFALKKLSLSAKSVSSLKETQLHHVLNNLVSLFNSVLQSVFSVWLFLSIDSNPVSYNRWIRPWVVNFASYLVYDTVCCLWYRGYLFKAEPGLVVHHVVVLFSLVSSLFGDASLMYYQVIATLCEVNSVHLHIRNTLKLVNPHFSALRWPNEIMNLFTFVSWRYLSSAYLVYQAALQFSQRVWYVASWWMFLAIALFAINNSLFYTILRGYRRDWIKLKRK